MKPEITNSEIYQAVRLAIIDALEIVRSLEAQNSYISKRIEFPEISYFKSGLPHIRQKLLFSDTTPTDYTSLFSPLLGSKPIPKVPQSWDQVWHVAKKISRINDFLKLSDDKNDISIGTFNFNLGQARIKTILEMMLDYYINSTKLRHFKWQRFLPIFLEWIYSIQAEKLYIEFLVPILFLNFDFKSRFKLSGNASIEKLDDNLQLARNVEKSITSSAHQVVVGAATHSFVLHGWVVKNDTKDTRDNVLKSIESYSNVMTQIERFFASLRIVTKYDVGYAQIICRPVHWCDNWKAYLKIPYVTTIRKYPDHFDDYGWVKTPPLISRSELSHVNKIYNRLCINESNKLEIASKRLNSASLRKEEEDAVLDVMIGLESLLVGDTTAEILHKLAMRLAALNKIEQLGNYSSEEIFKSCKDLYKYRSNLVHGSHKAKQLKEIKTIKGKEIPALSHGLELLRHSIQVISKRPELLEDGAIDKYICNILDKP